MKLERVGASMTVLAFSDGLRVLVSYETPVAAQVPGIGFVKTGRFVSRVSQDHIRKWINGNPAATWEHERLVALLEE